eukprot:TRINITY_DN18387_c0_g2_i1.p1 TRINITY_DN18387_c0_g2~~TRINITY_DN18387_c0_g2_i1.p1  ORF type:complete len:715 (-),score=105.21 TRINITY_DN18387_c0_g2_i1:348-2450(-)
MVAWEKQLEVRSVPAWRDKYVQYGRLKRKLERMGNKETDSAKETTMMMKRALSEHEPSASVELETGLLEDTQRQVNEFMEDVYHELDRAARFYTDAVTALEAKVSEIVLRVDGSIGEGVLQPAGDNCPEYLEHLHLEAAQLTEYVLLNVEALRKIVKKMDKICGTEEQKQFVDNYLKRSALATDGNEATPFNGERARLCRKAIEACLSPERIQELRSKAMAHGGVRGVKKTHIRPTYVVSCSIFAALCIYLSASWLPDAPRAQRCVGLVAFTVSMWISEAAPFEATALLVPPLVVVLELRPGSKRDQAKAVLDSVFTDSLYLVLCGFVMSSVFTKCQLECRMASVLQRRFGERPRVFLLAVMVLGLGLSSILSNVTAPLLLVEVLKPLLKDRPTDSRYSRALLLGLAFSCNIGGMTTPISSPQNIAALTILRQNGGNITWAQWLVLSVPFCFAAVLVGWVLLLAIYRCDVTAKELARISDSGGGHEQVPVVTFEKEELTWKKVASLLTAAATLASFACQPVADLLGGTSMVAVLFVAVALGTGMISRQTFNSYSWHLLFLIGGGSALGLAVRESGLLQIMTQAAQRCLSSVPAVLIVQLVFVIVAITTFVSHTVAALVVMPLVVDLGAQAGVRDEAVLFCGLACSVACALPMTSFPNVNSLMAVDDHGKPWLSMWNFLIAGTPMTILITVLLSAFIVWLT